MATELVHYTVSHGVGRITLDSPDNRNALSAQLRRELYDRLAHAIADHDVRVIVLENEGPAFCAGMDLKEVQAAGNDNGVYGFPAILEQVWASPTPIVAKVGGMARAGGVGLIAACDIAVGSREASFAFSEVRIGAVPAVISVTVQPRLDPRSAHELLLTGETFDAERALSVGLLNSSVDTSELDTEVDRYIEMLRLGAPGALAATKSLLRKPRPYPIGEDFANMAAISAEHFASEEAKEGMRAFIEKRQPDWAAR